MTVHAPSGPCKCGLRGWMPGLEHIPTAALGYADMPAGTMKAAGVINHIMQGFQTTMIGWAQERPARTKRSAHFTVSRAGRKVQHVSIFDPAWHAGGVSKPSWKLLKTAGSIIENPNRYSVGIEHEGFSVDPGYPYDYLYSQKRPWPEAMVEASIDIQRWVLATLGLPANANTVTGHFATDSVTRKDDPGAAWPQIRIIAALQPTKVTPPKAPSVSYKPWLITKWWGDAFKNGAKPVRFEDGYAIYEVKVKA